MTSAVLVRFAHLSGQKLHLLQFLQLCRWDTASWPSVTTIFPPYHIAPPYHTTPMTYYTAPHYILYCPPSHQYHAFLQYLPKNHTMIYMSTTIHIFPLPTKFCKVKKLFLANSNAWDTELSETPPNKLFSQVHRNS